MANRSEGSSQYIKVRGLANRSEAVGAGLAQALSIQVRISEGQAGQALSIKVRALGAGLARPCRQK